MKWFRAIARSRPSDTGGFHLWQSAIHLLVLGGLIICLTPNFGWACACGCGVFEVATPSLLPNGAGGMVWTEYDFMNQYINWRATQPASETLNNDKRIETNFVTVGAQYMFNRSWGVMLEVPY